GARRGDFGAYRGRRVEGVLIDDREGLGEARRVGTVAIIMLRYSDRGHAEVAFVETLVAHEASLEAPMTLVVASDNPDRRWLECLSESLAEEPAYTLEVGTRADISGAEVVALLDEGVLPLPGCFLAARKALGSDESAGGVAVKLLSSDGALEAAGVTVFEDGSYAGVAEGSFEIGAPWHEYVRETSWGPGLMLFNARALLDIDRSAARCH